MRDVVHRPESPSAMRVVIALVALEGCASSTRGSDAAFDAGIDAALVAPDATRALDAGPDVAAPIGPTTDIVVRVVVGPYAPLPPGVGVSVRAELASGYALETTTDADGVAHLPLALAAGPWDVTVARVGLSAVSILDVTGPIDGVVYLAPIDPLAPSAPPHTATHSLSGAIVGVPTTTYVSLAGDGVQIVTAGDGGYTGQLFETPDAAPTTLYAVALGSSRPDTALNAVVLPDVPRDRDVVRDVVFPDPPAVPAMRTQTLALADGGFFGPGDLCIGGLGWGVKRFDALPFGLTVGGARMPAGTASTPLQYTFQAYDGAFAPDAIQLFARICGASADPEISWQGLVAIASRDVRDGAVVAVPAVRSVHAERAASTRVTFTVDAPDYNASGFDVLPSNSWDGPGFATWQGYSYAGAPLRAHPLPTLPAGVTVWDLLGADTVYAVARLHDPAEGAAWSAPAWWTARVAVGSDASAWLE